MLIDSRCTLYRVHRDMQVRLIFSSAMRPQLARVRNAAVTLQCCKLMGSGGSLLGDGCAGAPARKRKWQRLAMQHTSLPRSHTTHMIVCVWPCDDDNDDDDMMKKKAGCWKVFTSFIY